MLSLYDCLLRLEPSERRGSRNGGGRRGEIVEKGARLV